VDTQVFASPRIEAGGGADAVGYADDTMKCQLVPVEDFDYGSVTFTEAQLAALKKAFPSGVCDYSKPSVAKQDAVTWLAYDVPGGRALGAAPVSVPFRGGAAPAQQDSRSPLAVAAGQLPATGGSVAAAVAAMLLVGAGLVLRRRRSA